uniref:NAC domain-containing protein n=1 Tax=Leersia perrieri TaxID=77586 RepID=A0A0D9XYT6_9ORYZ
MDEHGLDYLVARGFRFNPSQEEVVASYLPTLISGHPSVEIELVTIRQSVYAAHPRDLAADHRPVARSTNGDRWFYFFMRQGMFSRGAGAGGTWVASQRAKEIKKDGEGIKIGEVKSFRFKDDGNNSTDWLMEEYRLCSGQEFVNSAGDLEVPVVCRIYVSPRAPPDSAARQESAAHPPPSPPRSPEESEESEPPNRDPTPPPAPKASPLKRSASPPPSSAKKIRGPTSRRLMVDSLEEVDDDGFGELEKLSNGDDEPPRNAGDVGDESEVDDDTGEFDWLLKDILIPDDDDILKTLDVFDDPVQKAVGVGDDSEERYNGSEVDDIGEFTRLLQDDNVLDAFDVLDAMAGDPIDKGSGFLEEALTGYGNEILV